MNLFPFIYLGLGALCHALFYSSHFDPAAAMMWVWILVWPVMLFIHFAAALAAIAILILAYVGVRKLLHG